MANDKDTLDTDNHVLQEHGMYVFMDSVELDTIKPVIALPTLITPDPLAGVKSLSV